MTRVTGLPIFSSKS